jgi:cellobiose dehydrogenase (acceptor)
VSGGLQSAGWSLVDPMNNPDRKNRTFMRTPYMFSNGERGGPMATYLVSAKGRSNFALWMNTVVKRVVRSKGHVTGVEVEPFLAGGYSGTVKLTPVTGRVILSAGTFGSAKILLRSEFPYMPWWQVADDPGGIGPSDQLEVVSNSADGPSMVADEDWIILPVGYNLEDHTNVRHRCEEETMAID